MRRAQQCLGLSDRPLERDDPGGLPRVLDVLVVEGQVAKIEDLDGNPRRSQLGGGADEPAVVRRTAKTAGESQDRHLAHDAHLPCCRPVKSTLSFTALGEAAPARAGTRGAA